MPTPNISSPIQRERKREIDRKAQRAARERTRTRIAHLEQAVQAAGSGNNDGIMKQYLEVLEENRRLNSILARIRTAIGSADIGTPLKEDPKCIPALNPDGTKTSQVYSESQPPVVVEVPVAINMLQGEDVENQISAAADAAQLILPANLSVHQIPSAALPMTDDAGAQNLIEVLNAAFRLVQPFRANADCLENDIPVRAVLHGWDVTEALHALDCGWQFIKLLDSLLFSRCRQIERLAILVGVRFKLRYTFDAEFSGSRYLPQCLLPRPVEVMAEHPPLNDYLIWFTDIPPRVKDNSLTAGRPSLREHLALYGTCMQNNQVKSFANHIRFNWPYDFRDAYLEHRTTKMYCVSPTFNANLRDDMSWGLSWNFFQNNLEFIGVVPVMQET